MITRIVEEVAVEDFVDDLIDLTMMIRRTRMMLEVVVIIKDELIFIMSMIITIDIVEEEVEDKDLEEEAFVGNFFTVEKKGIENLNVPSAKHG